MSRTELKNVCYTSDMVHVVRCKDCKYSTEDDTATAYVYPLLCKGQRWCGVFPDWYCEHGERRDDGTID